MESFAPVTSTALLLDEPNVDTDQIIPAQHVNAKGQAALAAALFRNRRLTEPGFVLHSTDAAACQVLVVGPNFGCGSSREAAAWALGAWGFRTLIGTSFNDTFSNNCLQNAILPVPLAVGDWARLVQRLGHDPGTPVTVDLDAQTVTLPNERFCFTISHFRREMLLSGQDELSYILNRDERIAAWEDAQDKAVGILRRDAIA
ncbi:3-isopropylmalate dehydratase small subunit [Szabonella alba]|uniref:3-isopropylmalate dehydratase n=1 Tax=Szabonella alba TaxID=2804194 RepID=A0A8K0VCL9_9RHOB|nr:3-isopropylmalate dehydratase small subunit [Szabonella alba]MBL4919226.1 3-isopropylmalate dehydratase small subunit [Szabonella alba]